MRKTRKYSEDVPFSLTSMMDMMTIILVFMIKNIDAEGQLVTQAENLVLPNSTSKVQPKEVSLTVVVDNGFVVVDNEKIVPTADVLAQDSLLVEKVNAVLEERRQIEKDHALANNLPADEAGRIIVQIDKNIPYDAMYASIGAIARAPACICVMSGQKNLHIAM